MSDRNPMLQNRNNPMAVLGAIPTKGFLDRDTVRQFQQNAENPHLAPQCFPGGLNDINHDILEGYLSFGKRDTHTSDVAQGEADEQGVVSVSGLCWGEKCSQRELEDEWYFQGVATTEERLTNPLDGTTSDPESGYAMITVGTHSIINNGPRAFFPGNLVTWQIPRAPFHSRGDGRLFNDNSLINKTARFGVPNTTFHFEVAPFDYTDFSVPLAAAFAAQTIPYSDNGIADVPFSKALPNTSYQQARPHSCLQDDALALKFGTAAIALSFIETLLRNGMLEVPGAAAGATAHTKAQGIAQLLGLFDAKPDKNALLLECQADLFLNNANNGDENREAAVRRLEEDAGQDFSSIATQPVDLPKDAYNRLRLHALDLMIQGIAGSWKSKTEKIIGVAKNCAAVSDTLDVVFGHHTI
ncbi:MAG: hypothetical protein K2Q45_06855 [Nitrosomonas sp.]|nr:hypothetical protein [Nitrosomonas sp.]